MSPSETHSWFAARPGLAAFLDERHGPGPAIPISQHPDVVTGVGRGYGSGQQPEDYLESFGAWITDNLNEIPALLVVTQRPRDLTRTQLRELRLKLDQAGYGEIALRTAWRDTTNQDIAATIIGFIRRKALGSPLLPYEERVQQAVSRILSSQSWTNPQRRWLKRIGKQLKVETVVDRQALDEGQFGEDGGFQRLNRVFGGKLGEVLTALNTELWRDVG